MGSEKKSWIRYMVSGGLSKLLEDKNIVYPSKMRMTGRV
jgi:hypothetical protein